VQFYSGFVFINVTVGSKCKPAFIVKCIANIVKFVPFSLSEIHCILLCQNCCVCACVNGCKVLKN
jgi:hypothetical protein